MKNNEHVNRRTLESKSIKATFNKLTTLETYWMDKNEQYIKQFPGIGTHEEAVAVTKETLKDIVSNFKEGDEIIHFDDHNVAPRQMEREYLLLRRNGNVIKSVLIRMS